MSLVTRTEATECINAQFRAEAYKVLRHADFTTPVNSIPKPRTLGRLPDADGPACEFLISLHAFTEEEIEAEDAVFVADGDDAPGAGDIPVEAYDLLLRAVQIGDVGKSDIPAYLLFESKAGLGYIVDAGQLRIKPDAGDAKKAL